MFEYETKGVCSSKISFEVDNNKLRNVKFYGGCNGNLSGISSLVEGMDVDDVINKINGTKCGIRSTSCPDQLALALKEYKAQQ